MQNEPAIEIRNAVAALPNAVRIPAQALLEAGLIDERAMATALNGASAPGEQHRLLYHLLVIRALRDSGIEVDDTVRMAVKRDRRVNFAWSPSRWKDEHNRLSRMETLERLSADNLAYDLSAYRRHLPSHWLGYLIPSSRRLGMEGLRQRHCVAGYHAQVSAGNCAIAVAFLRKARWTLELYQTGDPAQPVYVRQMKGRYNRMPDTQTREALCSQLGLPSHYARSHNGVHGNHRQLAEGYLNLALPVLREHRVGEVIVDFDGSGDSGSIEGLRYVSENGEQVGSDMLDSIRVRAPNPSYHQRRAGKLEGEEVAQRAWTIDELLKDAVYEYLEDTGVDWYNNEGGYGEFRLDVVQGQFKSEVYVRQEESALEHSEAYDLIAQEEL